MIGRFALLAALVLLAPGCCTPMLWEDRGEAHAHTGPASPPPVTLVRAARTGDGRYLVEARCADGRARAFAFGLSGRPPRRPGGSGWPPAWYEVAAVAGDEWRAAVPVAVGVRAGDAVEWRPAADADGTSIEGALGPVLGTVGVVLEGRELFLHEPAGPTPLGRWPAHAPPDEPRARGFAEVAARVFATPFTLVVDAGLLALASPVLVIFGIPWLLATGGEFHT